jgi:sialic acid synthase SpsE
MLGILNMQRPKVIAEIGVNHNGSMDILLEMVGVAAAAKCDYVKFQTRTPDEDTPREVWDQLRRPPWNLNIEIPYIEYRRKMELSPDDYIVINERCNRLGIKWTTSCWGLTALHFITNMGVDLPALKVPSAKLTNEPLLRAMAKWAKKFNRELWVSTGMSTQEEVDEAVAQIKDEMGSLFTENVVLFNCNSSYPAKTTELNLSLINNWRPRYGCRIGYSSHSTTLGTSVSIIYLGYSHLEFHITFDRNAPGSDHSSAITYGGAFKLMSGLKDLEDAYGDGIKRIYDSELGPRKKLRG